MTEMRWIKHGRIFIPDSSLAWSRSHAQVPSAMLLDDRIRVYYASRDANGRSRTSFFDVCRQDPTRILYRHLDPVMDLGQPGAHDEDGVMVGCVAADGDRTLLYYTGWSRGGSVPYRVAIGLAASSDGGVTFERVFEGPIVDRTRLEPHMTMSPYVLHELGGSWRMWYGSGVRWVDIDGTFEPIYVIKYAESSNGLVWTQPNTLCIEPLHEFEANTRPGVLRNPTGYEMWFSYRHSRDFRDGSGAYRIGYALSSDGKVWSRQPDPGGLEPGPEAWDGRMMAYPSVVDVDGRRLMFYNGDGFGRSGVGFASLDARSTTGKG
jgi:hypothetical protein